MAALTETQAATAFALWHRVVLGSIPKERLLLLDLFSMSSDELWARLCDFVDKPLPPLGPDGKPPPFPHLQYGKDIGI